MIVMSENLRKLRNRDIFKEIRDKVSIIQETTRISEEIQEEQRQKEHDKILEDIFGE